MNYLELITVICVGVLPGIVTSLVIAKNPTRESFFGKYSFLLMQTTQAFAIISLLLYISSQSAFGLQSIGLSFNGLGFGEVGILWVGIIAFYSYAYLKKAVQKEKRKGAKNITQPFANYENIPERIVVWFSVLFSVFAEDLLYRGYLVLWLSEKTGNTLGWALLSIGLSILAHLYQGLSQIGYHLILASTFVTMAIVAGNIYPVIAFHLFWNTIQIVRYWQKIDRDKGNRDKEKTLESPETA